MQPQTIKHISKPIAEKHGVKKEDVEDLFRCFYSDFLRKKMLSLENKQILIPNLGSFKVNMRIAKETLDKYDLLRETLSQRVELYQQADNDFESTKTYESYIKKIAFLNNVIERIKEFYQQNLMMKLQKRDHRFRRKEYDNFTKNQNNLEEQDLNN